MGRRSSAGRMGRGVISEVEVRVEDMVEVVVGCEIVGMSVSLVVFDCRRCFRLRVVSYSTPCVYQRRLSGGFLVERRVLVVFPVAWLC